MMRSLDMLVPAPKQARISGGVVRLGRASRILVEAGTYPGAERAGQALQEGLRSRFGLAVPLDASAGGAAPRGSIVLKVDGNTSRFPESPSPDEGYRIDCPGGAAELTGAGERGLLHAVRSLLAVARRAPGGAAFPAVEITDWPSLAFRGVMEDLSRGKVPKLENLKRFATRLAGWKFNAMQLYVEHTFTYKKHPQIGKGWSALTPGDVRELDAHCRRVGIELVPSLASFGHLDNLLKLPKYRKLCVGAPWRLLMPGEERTYRLLDDLYSEYIPCFSSPWFNVNCDETFDLGKGRSEGMVKKLGLGEVYLRHILRLYGLVTKKYGKRMMMWGDIIGHHPELVKRLPKDIIMLPWGYFNTWRTRDMRRYVKSGMDFVVCPGTCAWHSPSPWSLVSNRNIRSACSTARETGGLGTMTTDWGDGGHQQPLGLSIYGFANAAEQAWAGGRAPQDGVDRRFSRAVFGDARGDAARLYRLFGEANNALGISPVYVMWWYTVNFALLFYENDVKGKLFARVKPRGLARLARCVARIDGLLRRLEGRRLGSDLLRRELRYSVDLLRHLVARLKWMSDIRGGAKGASVRARGARLLGDLGRLRRTFLKLWNARNRPHRREIQLKHFANAERFYRSLVRAA